MRTGWYIVPCALLLACGAPVPVVQDQAPATAMDALRGCATISVACRGIPALAQSYPALCTAEGICMGESGSEVLAAMELPNRDICGLRSKRGPDGEFAILGRWYRKPDGTLLYRQARFLDPSRAAGIRTPQDFARSCAQL